MRNRLQMELDIVYKQRIKGVSAIREEGEDNNITFPAFWLIRGSEMGSARLVTFRTDSTVEFTKPAFLYLSLVIYCLSVIFWMYVFDRSLQVNGHSLSGNILQPVAESRFIVEVTM